MTGDQTGREICERAYFNYPWDFILRYTGGVKTATGARTLRYDGGSAYMSGEDVYVYGCDDEDEYEVMEDPPAKSPRERKESAKHEKKEREYVRGKARSAR